MTENWQVSPELKEQSTTVMGIKKANCFKILSPKVMATAGDCKISSVERTVRKAKLVKRLMVVTRAIPKPKLAGKVLEE